MLKSTNFPLAGASANNGCGRVDNLRREADHYWALAHEWRGSPMELVCMQAAIGRQILVDSKINRTVGA